MGVAGAGEALSQPATVQTVGQRTNEVSNLSWNWVSQQPVRNCVLTMYKTKHLSYSKQQVPTLEVLSKYTRGTRKLLRYIVWCP